MSAFSPVRPKRQGWNDDRRYHLSRWRLVRARVLKRDGYRCQITRGCERRASIADHIIAASPQMSDAEFFAEANLRAACVRCNLGRGNRERGGAPNVVRPVTALGGRSLSGGFYRRPPLALSLPPSRRRALIVADYTRTPAESGGRVLGHPERAGRPLGRGVRSW